MKKVLAIVLFAFACNLAFAQTDENKKSSFQLSFISPLGTNGVHSPAYTNDYSLNLLVGISKNEQQLTLGGLSNIILNDTKGVQVAGLSNYVGNSGEGVQWSGLANINKGKFIGLQVAGLSNYVGNSGKGVQWAGLANVNKGAFSGFQLAGLVNTAAGVKGAQVAGLVNVAGDIQGFQLAGLVNIAKDVKGVQFTGLINIAENSDIPIGLINIIKNGEMGIAVTYDGLGNTVASFRSGGKYTYGILGVGYNHKIKKNGWVTEAGFGAHIPVAKWFRINNELKASSIGCDTDEPVLNAGYSLLPAFRIGRHFELFGGASINYMETKNRSAGDVFPNHSLWKGDNSAKLQQVYIGYQVGVQFIF